MTLPFAHGMKPIQYHARLLTLLHIGGVAFCLSLALGIYFLATRNNTIRMSDLGYPIESDEAEALLASEDRWSREVAAQHARQDSLSAKAKTALDWLGRAGESQRRLQTAQQLAHSHGLRCVDVQAGESFEGKRVQIEKASFRLEGSYASLCRFLHDLSSMDEPIWASELTMHISGVRDPIAVHTQVRLPSPGQHTSAAKLIQFLDREGLSLPVFMAPKADEASEDAVASAEVSKNRG
jgi:hypothetical protein